MAEIESSFVTQKAIEQILTITLEEGDDILQCLKQALQENNIKECKIIDTNGFWKEGFMNYFLKNQFKSRKTFEIEKISAGSGKFTRQGNEYVGDLHIVVSLGNNRINGTLLEGKAAKELTIKAKFPKFIEEKQEITSENQA